MSVTLFLFVAGLLLVAQAAVGAHSTDETAGKGALALRVLGLPPGERAALTVLGPPQSPGAERLRRVVAVARTASLRLAPGSYRVKVAQVEVRRRHKQVRPGASALPLRRTLHVKVRPGKRARLSVRYGTIINPGVVGVSGRVAKVLGDPSSPDGVILTGHTSVRRGAVLSARPDDLLPNGLLARVTGFGADGVVHLRAASIYEVAPNMTFDIPLATSAEAGASQVVKCGESTGAGVKPYVDLSQFHATGGWTTTGWGPFKATTGATAELRFHAAAGVKVSSQVGLSCSLKLPALAFQGMAGPVPVYGGIRPGATVEIGAAGSLSTEASTDINVGAKISGVPLSAAPIAGFTSPRVDFNASVFTGVKAGLSLAAEVGIGAANAANIHVDLTNSLAFTAAPGQCSWDMDLGKLSATGEVGPLSISTPSTPALYHRNLWHAACGAPAPPPPPPPTAPAVTLPLVRATMSWGTDSDIDLYTWDDAGNLLYFGERDGIPGVELVEDVIPLEGEFVHAEEVLQETANPNRRYTFGICDFRGEGADVTLTVKDPGGGTRTFQRTLFEAGESYVVTTSPDGSGGYFPEPGWCEYVEP
ncbi:MAG TPA: hypothetical protein VGO13_04505 [Solirubrobacterales bacterium]|nr:hypothetical protein [Solirubrobacterales bacterium]